MLNLANFFNIKKFINYFKSCAFVEFYTKEAYQQALMQKSIEIPGLGIVTVEERKQKNRNFHQGKYVSTYHKCDWFFPLNYINLNI